MCVQLNLKTWCTFLANTQSAHCFEHGVEKCQQSTNLVLELYDIWRYYYYYYSCCCCCYCYWFCCIGVTKRHLSNECEVLDWCSICIDLNFYDLQFKNLVKFKGTKKQFLRGFVLLKWNNRFHKWMSCYVILFSFIFLKSCAE